MEEHTQFLKKVEDIIAENLANPLLNGAFIARKLNMSRMQLYRQMKLYLELDAGVFIRQKRIEYAKSELIHTSKYIYIISKEVGITNPTHFAKIFKKAAGMSPTAFRKENS